MALLIAAAQPPCIPLDVAANAEAHAHAVRETAADLLVFPELSLTGYELTAPAVSPTSPVLAPLVEACAESGTVAFVGAPVEENGERFIAMLRVDGEDARPVYRKQFLHGAENDHFSPGPHPDAGSVVIDELGIRIGLGICKDTGSMQHIAALTGADIDVYLAGVVHLPEEIAEQNARGHVIARTSGAVTVIANAAGPCSTTYPEAGGHSTAWAPDGTQLAGTAASPGDVLLFTYEPSGADGRTNRVGEPAEARRPQPYRVGSSTGSGPTDVRAEQDATP